MSTLDEDVAPEPGASAGDRHAASPPRPRPWNIPAAWNIPDVAPADVADPTRPLATLVSFHYLGGAVRRRWLRCVVLGILGLVLGTGFLLLNPPLPTATTTLILTHDPSMQASDAIATDISLMTTRTVAEKTVAALGLSMTPEGLLAAVTVVPTNSSEIVQITMTGPSGPEAVRRLQAFTQEYLTYRNETVSGQTKFLIEDYDNQIADLQAKLKATNDQIQSLRTKGDLSTEYTDALADKSRLSGQVNGLEQQVQAATMQRDSVVKASHPIDPATAVATGRLRRLVLVPVTGLIAGLAAALGLVVLQAILSDKLWLRVEVATALRAPVRVSVRRLGPLPRLVRAFGPLPSVGKAVSGRARGAQLAGDALVATLMGPQRRASVGVLCLGNSGEMCFALLAAALELKREGRDVALVDLTTQGVVQETATALRLPPEEAPEVFRRPVVPSLRNDPAALDRAAWEELASSRTSNRVTLILADVDTAVGVDHLAAWTDDVVVAVSAGRSSVELVRTTRDLVRAAGLTLHGAILLRALRDDVSSGGAGLHGGDDGDRTPTWDVATRPATERLFRP